MPDIDDNWDDEEDRQQITEAEKKERIDALRQKIIDAEKALSGDTIQIPLAEYEKLKADAERLEEKNWELLALLEEAESVLRVAGCTITSDKIADAICKKECHD